jgi:uncharacterized protein
MKEQKVATSNQSGSKSNTGEKKSGGRGFASMDPQRQREIASEGGRAAHLSGNAHEFTSEEARAAGRKSHSGQSRAKSASSRSSTSRSSAAQSGNREQHAEAGSESQKDK